MHFAILDTLRINYQLSESRNTKYFLAYETTGPRNIDAAVR